MLINNVRSLKQIFLNEVCLKFGIECCVRENEALRSNDQARKL